MSNAVNVVAVALGVAGLACIAWGGYRTVQDSDWMYRRQIYRYWRLSLVRYAEELAQELQEIEDV